MPEKVTVKKVIRGGAPLWIVTGGHVKGSRATPPRTVSVRDRATAIEVAAARRRIVAKRKARIRGR